MHCTAVRCALCVCKSSCLVQRQIEILGLAVTCYSSVYFLNWFCRGRTRKVTHFELYFMMAICFRVGGLAQLLLNDLSCLAEMSLR